MIERVPLFIFILKAFKRADKGFSSLAITEGEVVLLYFQIFKILRKNKISISIYF